MNQQTYTCTHTHKNTHVNYLSVLYTNTAVTFNTSIYYVVFCEGHLICLEQMKVNNLNTRHPIDFMTI